MFPRMRRSPLTAILSLEHEPTAVGRPTPARSAPASDSKPYERKAYFTISLVMKKEQHMNILKNATALKTAAFGAALTMAVAGIASEAQATQGSGGWQNVSTFNVPTGQTHGFFSYSCPSSNYVARSGAFFPNPTLQNLGITLGVNGPRIDEGTSSGFQTWGFFYDIPGGAPAGTQILFDVYCTKTPI